MTTIGTGIEGHNSSVRLRTPQAQETEFYACEHGHRRVPSNVSSTGHCRTCTVLHPNAKTSRWVKHEVAAKIQETEVENPWLTDYNARQQAARAKEQAIEQARWKRESQERKTRDAQSAAFDLMDASMEEQSVVTKRLAGRNCLASEYVAEIRRLRAERTF